MRLPRRKQGVRGYRNWLLVVLVLAAYGLYVVYWPNSAQVASVYADKSNPQVLNVVIGNPTFKIISGELTQIQTEVDLYNPRTNSTSILEAYPKSYPFFLLPFQSQTLAVVMNGRVLSATDYDITLHIDTGGEYVFTLQTTNSTA